MFIENGHDRNYLYFIVRKKKHQAPKTENRQQHRQTTMDTNYRTQNKKILRNTGCKVIFTSAAKLKNILCNNKSKTITKHLPRCL